MNDIMGNQYQGDLILDQKKELKNSKKRKHSPALLLAERKEKQD